MRIKVGRQEFVHVTFSRGIHFSHRIICDGQGLQRPLERGVIKVDGNGVDVMDGANDVFNAAGMPAEKGAQVVQICMCDELGLQTDQEGDLRSVG